MKVYKLYFSPTGGTKKVIDRISSVWDCQKVEIDLSDMKYELSNIVFEKTDVCIVAVPSFSGRVPQFIIPKLKGMKGIGVKAILVTTFGNRAFDDTLIELQDTLQSVGFCCVCAVAAVTEHSVMPKYGKGRPDQSDKKELDAFAKKCKNAVENIDGQLVVPGNRPYRKYLTIPIKPKINKNCNKCGLCMLRCPVQAIPSDIKNVDKDKCISCLQCVKVCPKNARYVSRFMQKIAEIKMRKLCKDRKQNQLFLPQ